MAKPAAVLRGCGGRVINQGRQQARIDELQLGGIYHPVEPVPGPNFHSFEQVHLFEHADVPGCRLVIQADLSAQLRVVAHLTRKPAPRHAKT
jgi:hypothetical protein